MHAIAYVNWGRWVADCPREGCSNARALEYGQSTFVCGVGTPSRPGPDTCGLVCEVEWPASPLDIERLLADRPVPSTRNWRPPEDLHDLLTENLMHGALPVGIDTLQSGPVLGIVDGTITHDAVAPARHHALGIH